MSEKLIKEFTATAEVMGTELTLDGARLFVSDLKDYSENTVLEALAKCRREVRGKLTLADVISRIDDGRPGPNEAWAMMPRSEMETVVWTDEMAAAMCSAQPLLDCGDTVAARMAFMEQYQREVSKARHEKREIKWTPSLGRDQNGREAVLRDATDKKRLSVEQAKILLPHGNFIEVSKMPSLLSGPSSIGDLLARLMDETDLPKTV